MNTVSITAGNFHTCAYSRDRYALDCWGLNDYGQTSVPKEFSQFHEIEIIMSGQNTTCVQLKDSFVYCWGANPYNIYDKTGLLIRPFLSGKGITYIEYGSDDTLCAIKVSPNLTSVIDCWGKCTGVMCNIPSELKDYHDNYLVSVGYDHVCTLRSPNDFSIEPSLDSISGCWGADYYGQSTVPNEFKENLLSIAAGKYVTCALKFNYYFDCFGKDNSIPVNIKYFGNAITAGGRHSCANLGGKLECFGNNSYHQLEVPEQLKINSWYEEAGWDYSCSIGTNRSVHCWGLNSLGQTDLPDTLLKPEDYIEVKDLAVGLSHACVIYGLNGEILCWGGSNEFNQLDFGDVGFTNVQAVAIGDEYSCIYCGDNQSKHNRIRCIGDNSIGQIDVPLELTTIQSGLDYTDLDSQLIYSMSAGDGHTCSEYGNEYVFNLLCWGSDSHGQSSVPWEYRFNRYNYSDRSLSAGTAHTCLIDNNNVYSGVLVCWGVRTYGYKGDQFGSKVHGPYKVSAGYNHDCAIGNQGTVECVGDNDFGECNVPHHMIELEIR